MERSNAYQIGKAEFIRSNDDLRNKVSGNYDNIFNKTGAIKFKIHFFYIIEKICKETRQFN